MFTIKTVVRKHERGLLFRDGDFLRILDPGTYRFWKGLGAISVERYDVTQPRFDHPLSRFLMETQPAMVEQYFTAVRTGDAEVALVFDGRRLLAIVGPEDGALFWRGVADVRVDRVALADNGKVGRELAARLTSLPELAMRRLVQTAMTASVVPDKHVGLVVSDGEVIDSVGPGLHAYWRFGPAVDVELFDLRLQTLEVSGQEILTKDKVAIRVNVSAVFQYVDPATAIRLLKDPMDHLYKEVQFGLRAAIGTRTLDALLEDKAVIDRVVGEHLAERFADSGVVVARVGVKDVILPGDMKALLARVVEAEKEAQANVIRRREETNATRSLLNTAKVMESNAVALRLKELETLERLTENVGNLSVVGGLDGLLNELGRRTGS